MRVGVSATIHLQSSDLSTASPAPNALRLHQVGTLIRTIHKLDWYYDPV